MDLKNIYLEEAEELINMMEDTMLLLEKTPEDQGHVAEIFRHMHTLKGTSSMYGSNKVADFIHDLETIYDNIRSGSLAITKQIIDSTFASLDHLKNIVGDPDISDKNDQKKHQTLIEEFKSILNDSNEDASGPKNTDIGESKFKTYHVHFKPNEDIFLDGTNPILLIDELAELGKTKVFSYFDESLASKDFNEEKCYTTWDVILVTEQDENVIKDVFIFVEDSSDVTVDLIEEGDLLENESFVSSISERNYSDRPFQAEELKLHAKMKKKQKAAKEKVSDSESASSVTTTSEKKSNKVKEEVIEEEVEPVRLEDHEEVKIENESPAPQMQRQKSKNISSIRVPSDKLDELMNQVSELITAQAGLSLYSQNNFDPHLEAISESVEKLSRRLRDIAFGMTLIKIDNLFTRFQRTVRDISNNLNKSVDFITEGGETELDKKIIENLSDPLMHLIRNCLDHGIETEEERKKLKKPAKGKIKLKAFYSGAKVHIVVEDDGKGLDVEKIKQKAIDKKLINKEDKLSDKEIFDLIFSPGFSTAENITDISGRGVGMDVVKKNILDIRGDIVVESEKNVGTKIILSLPLTLSVIDGLLVRIQNTN